MTLRAYDTGTRQPVSPGDELTDFRGEPYRFIRPLESSGPGRAGKVEVAAWAGSTSRRILYANVFGLYVQDE